MTQSEAGAQAVPQAVLGGKVTAEERNGAELVN